MRYLVVLIFAGLTLCSFGQRDLTPNSRKSAFGGARDFRDLRYTGLQVQLGPTYTITRTETARTDFDNSATRGNYSIDPRGRFGAYAEVGMAHFPKKRSKLSLKIKKVLVSYIDWGVGFKLLGGREFTNIDYTDVVGNVVSSDQQSGNFYNGYAYGRFSVHKNWHFKRLGKNFFLDNSIGANVDYRVLSQTAYSADVSGISPQAFHQPLVAQLHYGLGFGFRTRRGTYIIPGVRMPILGINEWDRGNPTLTWFSSKYWPMLAHVKVINLFQKKRKNGCPPAEINDQDRETQQNR